MAEATMAKIRNPWGVVGLTIITLGIYGLYWQYVNFRDLKAQTGNGIGGGLGLLFAIIIGIVNAFLLPSEIGNAIKADGQQPPVSGLTGFWVLIPLVGGIIWIIKSQNALNQFWTAHGVSAVTAPPAPAA
jgi:hypothetical protein